jgi:glycogen operon protein
MLLGGDEFGRTQHGNNNAWCQDNETSWYDWTETPDALQMREFTRRLIALRHAHPVFRREAFLRGAETMGSGLPDVWWFRPDGMKMTRGDWQGGNHRLGMFLNGSEIPTRGPQGQTVEDDSFIVLFNAEPEEYPFMLPRRRFGAQWALELTTFDPDARPGSARYGARTEVKVPGHCTVILKRVI